jgi:dTMP kinase
LVAFEGLDGSGKTTQASLLLKALEADGPAIILKEPTDGPWGRELRRSVKAGRNAALELEYLIKDRAHDVVLNIAPALAEGRTVIMDRYILSNVAYQGALPGGDPVAVIKANQGFPWPEATFLLEVGVLEGLRRASARGTLETAFENEAYLTEVKKVYDGLEAPGLVRLDGSLPEGEIFERVLGVIRGLKGRGSKPGPAKPGPAKAGR